MVRIWHCKLRYSFSCKLTSAIRAFTCTGPDGHVGGSDDCIPSSVSQFFGGYLRKATYLWSGCKEPWILKCSWNAVAWAIRGASIWVRKNQLRSLPRKRRKTCCPTAQHDPKGQGGCLASASNASRFIPFLVTFVSLWMNVPWHPGWKPDVARNTNCECW